MKNSCSFRTHSWAAVLALGLAGFLLPGAVAGPEPPPRPSIFQLIVHLLFGKDSGTSYYETVLKGPNAPAKGAALTVIRLDVNEGTFHELNAPPDAHSVLLNIGKMEAFYLRKGKVYANALTKEFHFQDKERLVVQSSPVPIVTLIGFVEKEDALLAITQGHKLVKIRMGEGKISGIRSELTDKDIRILSQESVCRSGAIVYAEEVKDGTWQLVLLPKGLESEESKPILRLTGTAESPALILEPRWSEDASSVTFLAAKEAKELQEKLKP